MATTVSPYVTQVTSRTCACRQGGKQLSRHKILANAVATIGGYWNVYLAFFGDQMVWLDFTVTDVRDGKLMWRNGRTVVEEKNGG